jgi:hypothetical protein
MSSAQYPGLTKPYRTTSPLLGARKFRVVACGWQSVSRSNQSMRTLPLYRLLVILLFATPLVQADWITIDFAGSIFSSTVPQLPVGTPYSGQASYQTPGTLVLSNASLSWYALTGPSEGVVIAAGGYTFSSVGALGSAAQVLYRTFPIGLGGDDYFLVGDSSDGPGYVATGDLPGLTVLNLGIQLTGSPGLLTSTSLPSVLELQKLMYPDYSAPDGVFSTAFVGFDNGAILGSLSSIQVSNASAVPEPATAGLSVFALLAIGFTGRRLRKVGKPANE